MTNFTNETALLATLQTFSREAFVGDEKVPQDICNFVLALALIYNDCKDGIFSNLTLAESKPTGEQKRSREWGAYNGIKVHFLRLYIALIQELLKLIRDNQFSIKHPFFIAVIQQLSKRDRDSWDALMDAALQKQTSNRLNKFLLMIRNKVSSHYDPKELYRGYRYHFFGNGSLSEAPFISRGTSMQSSRFYFADAAADGYLQSQALKDNELMSHVVDLTENLNRAIMQVVNHFIQKRGFAYKDYTS